MPKRHTFIISDESVNNHGFRVLTSGIDVTRYEKNPVVLVMHRQYEDWMPVGLAYDIRTDEQNRLLADVEFDENDELAVKIEKKVEGKFLRGVSMGLKDVEWSEDPLLMLQGQTLPTLSKSELLEISIANIPSNGNAIALKGKVGLPKDHSLIALSGDKDPAIEAHLKEQLLNKSKSNKTMNLKAFIAAFAGVKLGGAQVVTLSADATDADVINGITQLGAKVVELDAQINTKDTEITKLKADLEKALNDQKTSKAENLVDLAVGSGKITKGQREEWVSLAASNYDHTKKILDDMKAYEPATNKISGEDGDTLLKLSWDEADKQGKLAQIKANHSERYSEIYEAKFGSKPKNV